MDIRVGLGHDLHRLVSGRKLVLGNVPIEFDRGAEGHSDADVLLHAIVDALLGAAGLGDIGEWFPNTDPNWAEADSQIFLKKTLEEVHRRGWTLANLDCTIWAEQPKLTPYKPKIKRFELHSFGGGKNDIQLRIMRAGLNLGFISRTEVDVLADEMFLV